MKNFLLSLSMFFASSIAMTQVWAPAGATWHYDYENVGVSGYVKIQYSGDTIIEGKGCKILKKESHIYNYVTQNYETWVIGYEYTYLENSIVYYYRQNRFFTLYDFNANAGSAWDIAAGSPCDSVGKVMVDSAGDMIINTVPLKILFISPGPGSTWQFYSDTITERIGSFGYMFPEQNCLPDAFEGGPLRCYYDDSFGLFEKGAAPSCEYITGIEKIIPEHNFVKVYPVPTTSILTIKMNKTDGGVVVRLSDLSGQQLKHFETEKPEFSFDISDLKDGIYFISITDQAGNSWNRKIIKYNR